MNIVKSTTVLLILCALFFSSVCAVKKCFTGSDIARIFKGIGAGLFCFFTLASVTLFGDYVWPFERNVSFTMYATREIPFENSLSGPNSEFWRAAYEEYGFHAESMWFNPAIKESPLGFEWPEMDFEHHTYIITYGQELTSLSYNVWDVIHYPLPTGEKIGHAVLADDFNPNMVFIYEIRKMRIDNDP